jgi:hypothetical protein
VAAYYEDEHSHGHCEGGRHRTLTNYLQSRFNLDTNRVGTVALENRPPEGSSHTNWNGVVIVLLKVKR